MFSISRGVLAGRSGLGVVTLAWICVFTCLVMVTTYFALVRIEATTKQSVQASIQAVLKTTQHSLHIWAGFHSDTVSALASDIRIRAFSDQLSQALGEQAHSLTDQQRRERLRASPALARVKQILTPAVHSNANQGFFIISPERYNLAAWRDMNVGAENVIEQRRPQYLARAFAGYSVFIPPMQSDVPLAFTDRFKRVVPTMFFAAPILDQQQQVIAVLALRLPHGGDLSRVLALGRMGESGESYIFDRQGLMLSNNRFADQLRRFGIIPISADSLLELTIRDPGGDLLAGYRSQLPQEQWPPTAMLRRALAGGEGVDLDGYRDYRGVQVFGAWSWDPILDVGLTTEIDVTEAMSAYTETRNILILILAATVLLALAMLLGVLWLRRRINRALRIEKIRAEQLVLDRTRDLKRAKEELEQANQELYMQANTDGLTGLANRRYFDEQLDLEWRRCAREKKSLSILLLDIDFFKDYNDHYGHQQGDACLQAVAASLQGLNLAQRPGDLIARYGGEEFVVVLSGGDFTYAQRIAKSIHHRLQLLNVRHAYSGVEGIERVSMSIGLATADSICTNVPQGLLHQADAALYQAKHEGRNRTCGHEQKLNEVDSSL